MRTSTLRTGAAAVVAASIVVGTPLHGRPSRVQRGTPAAAQTAIIETAPRDHAVAIAKAKLAGYFAAMDAKRQQTLRLLEGGKYNVNIRRITNAETALVHPNTIDVWVVLDGAGTLTTGGRIDGGKIVGGVSHPLEPGDVEFIPVGVPHGVSGVNGTITWLNIRWDTDWPANAEIGAGELPQPGGAARPPGRLTPIEYAQTERAVAIPRGKLAAYRRDMAANNRATLRIIEGGHFNVNIRRITEPSVELHKVTVDTWVVLEGSGTVNAGFETRDGNRVAGTGQTFRAQIGDVFFIPSNLNHGFSAVEGTVSWLNIRWDDDYGK
jgi:mannose-6-phosphate isomerase-like protein (cupin superfamily)